MIPKPDGFHLIPYTEYHSKRESIKDRVGFDDIEQGMVVEAFTTNESLLRRNFAIRFTAQVSDTSPLAVDVDVLNVNFNVLSSSRLKRIEGQSYQSYVYPDTKIEDAKKPVEWNLTRDHRPLKLMAYGAFRLGFFSNWTDNDITDLNKATATITDEDVISTRKPQQGTQQRTHPLFPTSGE